MMNYWVRFSGLFSCDQSYTVWMRLSSFPTLFDHLKFQFKAFQTTRPLTLLATELPLHLLVTTGLLPRHLDTLDNIPRRGRQILQDNTPYRLRPMSFPISTKQVTLKIRPEFACVKDARLLADLDHDREGSK
jgi:hypothetical protein